MHRVAADAGEAGALALAAGHRRRAAGHHRLRRRPGRAGAPRRAARGAGRPGRPPGADPEGASSGCSTRTGRRRARSPAAGGVDLDSARQPGAGPRAGRAVRRAAGRRDGAAAARRRPAALRRVAVVGPCAADPRTFMGCYAFPNHVLPRHPGLGLGHRGADARWTRCGPSCPDVEVVHERGLRGAGRATGPASPPPSPRPAGADLCVALVGDLAGLFGHGTSGEGCDAEDLRLPGVQADLLAELLATGTPVVVVVVSGRPYALGDVHGRAAGLVQAFMPGEEGGAAIAGVLSGRVQPSGKLPVQIPRRPGRPAGHLPAAAAGRRERAASATSTRPRCSRSATAAPTPPSTLDDLRISDPEVPTDGEFTRHRAGPQHRRPGPARRSSSSTCTTCVAQVARPVRQLAGFARVAAGAGRGRRRRVPRARRPDRLHRPGPAADRRAGRDRGAGRHLGGRPAVPRTVRLTGPGAHGGRRPPAGHPA